MPNVTISIGGKDFQVACQPGEEEFLLSAAAVLDGEAQGLLSQVGRIPESQMLLMSGLVLADRVVTAETAAGKLSEEADVLRAEIAALKAAPPREVQVPFVPETVPETLAELAARAEALAAEIEDKARPNADATAG